ncbi:MAG: PatB family C-S lyase [Deltaproteobacteria bacterium]|nr:PatB family C-S lyase [Deltaproteobacteria bacterium]
MPTFDFDCPIDRRGTASLKWEKYADRDIIPLWVADMDFMPPTAVLDALKKRIDHGVLGYTRPPASLVETVVDMLQQQFAWTIQSEWIVWLPGLVTGINVACRTAGSDGDAVVTAVPVYPPFLSAPQLARRELITVPMHLDDHGWHWDLEALEARLTPATRLLLLCSPHNPVGRAFRRDELMDLIDICERHDLVICSDEIHGDLILDPASRHIPTAAIHQTALDRCITLMAPSKTFNIPGLGCSFAVIGNDRLRHCFRQAMAGIVPDVNVLGYTAAEAAYRHGWEWHMALLDYLRQNRDLVFREIGRIPPLQTTLPEATYLAWIDARGLGMENPTAFFEAAGVGLSDGKDFGAEGYVRLNFGCRRALLEEALARMRQAVINR